jgi:hypothetical protein
MPPQALGNGQAAPAGPAQEQQGAPAAPPGNPNVSSSKLAAIMRLLMGAETDEEYLAARKMAAQIEQMSDQDVQALMEGQEPQGGNFLRHLCEDRPVQYQAPRVPGGYHVAGQPGGTWVLAASLARFYAGLFSDMEAAGRPPSEDEVSDADDEIQPHGWTLEQEGRTWNAVRLGEEGAAEEEPALPPPQKLSDGVNLDELEELLRRRAACSRRRRPRRRARRGRGRGPRPACLPRQRGAED